MRVMFAGLAVLALVGCGPSNTLHVGVLEGEGAISVLPASAPDHSYIVALKNSRDFGYDVDDRSNRHAWALAFLKTQCPDGVVVGEAPIETGQTIFGVARRTWHVKVRCGAPAATAAASSR